MLPSPTALILVAILPHPCDLDIARLLGWYRIPLRSAPKMLRVDFLAFYQPASFGAAGGRIEFLAPVIGHELSTRGELLLAEKDHPRAREEYFKIQLGALLKLPEPIRARRWKRITFFYTTGAYLPGAKWVDDLVVRRDDRKIVWQALRERAAVLGGYQAELWPEAPDRELLLAVLGWRAGARRE